jgi:uracil-DNA glycosylase family 4
VTLKQRYEWFEKVAQLKEAVLRTWTPAQALATLKPRAQLPHLDPRGALIEAYVTKPRQRPVVAKTLPQTTALQVESPKQAPYLDPSSSRDPRRSEASKGSAKDLSVAPGSRIASSVTRASSDRPSFRDDKEKKSNPTHASPAALAAGATTLAELKAIVEAFEGCALKAMATKTVFADGNPEAKIMLVGEAPGAEEDLQGKPFVGLSGQLLDRMMAAIGLDRTQVYIANMLPWRPPGNRQPSSQELTQCLPFIQRQIELVKPQVLVLVGGVAAKTLLGRTDGIMRMRGQWHPYQTTGLETPIAATAIFHPAYLLRSPGQKREAWKDLLMIQDKLNTIQDKGH